jgi:hypothetical protein
MPTGDVILNPDQEVQARLRLVFSTFMELGTANAVVRYLRCHQLPLPARPLRGAAPQQIVWDAATSSLVTAILHNPAYAGAYAYGRSMRDPARAKPGRPGTGIIRLPMDRWVVLLHDRYPAYISWDAFMANQARLEANQTSYKRGHPGAVRRGEALLQGIAICARCGAHMQLLYSGPSGEFPVYKCFQGGSRGSYLRCQEVRALDLDCDIQRIVLHALAPDKLAIAVATLAEVEREDAALQKQWQLRLERARYESERARRQYDAVEPENRLVARTLERQWEDKLRALEQLEREYASWCGRQQLTVSEEDREQILALAQDLPSVWAAPTTTAADRKQLLRLLVDSVLLDNHRSVGRTWFQINWRTGATTEHWRVRRVRGYFDYAALDELERRIRELDGSCPPGTQQHPTRRAGQTAPTRSWPRQSSSTSIQVPSGSGCAEVCSPDDNSAKARPGTSNCLRMKSRAFGLGWHAHNERSHRGDRHYDGFGDPVVATAIVDRLLGNATVLNIRGRSYRMRAYQAADSATPR